MVVNKPGCTGYAKVSIRSRSILGDAGSLTTVMTFPPTISFVWHYLPSTRNSHQSYYLKSDGECGREKQFSRVCLYISTFLTDVHFVSRERCQGLIFASFVQLHWPELVYLIFFRCSRFWACGCLLGLRFSFFACCIVTSALLACIMACNASLYSCLSLIAKLIGYLFCFFILQRGLGNLWTGFLDGLAAVTWCLVASFERCSRLFCTVLAASSDLEVFLFLLHTCMK